MDNLTRANIKIRQLDVQNKQLRLNALRDMGLRDTLVKKIVELEREIKGDEKMSKYIPCGCPVTKDHLKIHLDAAQVSEAENDIEQLAHELGVALEIAEVMLGNLPGECATLVNFPGEYATLV